MMFEDTKTVYIVGKTTTAKPKKGAWYITKRHCYYYDGIGCHIEYFDGEWERWDGYYSPHSWKVVSWCRATSAESAGQEPPSFVVCPAPEEVESNKEKE